MGWSEMQVKERFWIVAVLERHARRGARAGLVQLSEESAKRAC